MDDTSPSWNRMRLALAGGDVRRYHTFREGAQNVAEHTYRVYHIAVYLADQLGVNLWPADFHYLMCHDIAEVQTGDVPFYAKRVTPEIKQVMDKAERKVYREYGYDNLDDTNRDLIKAAELIEMGMFAIEQTHRGNNEYKSVSQNIEEALHQKAEGATTILWQLCLDVLYHYQPFHQGSEAV